MPTLALRLSVVQSCRATRPGACRRCGFGLLQRHQACRKIVRDPQVAQVVVSDDLESYQQGSRGLEQCWLAMRAAREEHRGRLPAAVRLRRLAQRLGRDWPSYRVWAERADVPATNNRTEQGIGRLKVRARTVRGYQSGEGLLNGSMLAAAVGGPGMPDLAALLSAN